MTRRNVHHVVAETAKTAGIEFSVHPHMLRHATGYYLANAGQDTRAIQLYLGHKNISTLSVIPSWLLGGSGTSARTSGESHLKIAGAECSPRPAFSYNAAG
jgi:integrase